MKTVIIEFGTPAGSDKVYVSYASPRGGRTHAAYSVKPAHKRPIENADGLVVDFQDVPGDGPREIANALRALISNDWMRESFQPIVDGDRLVIKCGHEVSDVRFSTWVDGGGGTTSKILMEC